MIIAEIAQAHDGSIGILHSYIDALADTGVDAIKFQTHIAEAESSIHEAFRIPFSYVDKTRYDYWKRMELSVEQWIEVKDHCHKVGLLFISSPFSCKAVDVLEAAGVDVYKIGSGEVSNHLLLEKIAKTGKRVIVSSGMSTMDELDETILLFRKKNIDISILQCSTVYPSQPKDWGLHTIKEFKDRYKISTGFSDHSGGVYACLAATALGAEILEFHVVFDKRMFGPDAKASLEIDEVKMLVSGVNQIKSSLQSQELKDEQVANKQDLKNLFGKSLCINNYLTAGHVLTINDLEAKKPAGLGIAPRDYKQVIGKRLVVAKNQWDFLTNKDLNS